MTVLAIYSSQKYLFSAMLLVNHLSVQIFYLKFLNCVFFASSIFVFMA